MTRNLVFPNCLKRKNMFQQFKNFQKNICPWYFILQNGSHKAEKFVVSHIMHTICCRICSEPEDTRTWSAILILSNVSFWKDKKVDRDVQLNIPVQCKLTCSENSKVIYLSASRLKSRSWIPIDTAEKNSAFEFCLYFAWFRSYLLFLDSFSVLFFLESWFVHTFIPSQNLRVRGRKNWGLWLFDWINFLLLTPDVEGIFIKFAFSLF